ncbi:MAG: autotransporter domain-containing protein [Alphaproteobacteria bacterium]|nr:autotransporter domain-containing protein [Alphaproteobacteria bacterium]
MRGRGRSAIGRLAAGLTIGVLLVAGSAQAQTNGTWLLSPGTADYNTGTNWSSNTVPDSGATATFGTSNRTSIGISSSVSPGSFTFNSGASSYTFTIGTGVSVGVTGSGIANNSSSSQTFNVNAGTITFSNSASLTGSSLFINATNGGTINVFDSSNAGSATFSVSGSGSTLNFDDNSNAGSATITITNAGFACFCNNATAGSSTISLSGTGSELQMNSGTSFGTSTITNGTGATVQILGDVTGSSARYIGNGGTLDVTGATTSFSIGSIEGSGTISLGDKNITVGANGNSTTFSGVISGTNGTLTKTGSGTLTLSGADTFTGGTTVSGGALMVTGSLASGVTVSSGGTLGGTGSVTGNVVNSGTVAPGTIGSPLTINGNFTQNAGGMYQVALNSSGATRLVVNGTANLGGSVSVQAGSSYSTGTRYTILTATTISGSFSGTTSNLAFLTPTLTYDSTNAYLTLAVAANAFSRASQNGNQGAVGAVLDRAYSSATGDFATVLNAIVNLDTIQGPRALEVIGGQNYSGFSTVATQSATAFMNNFAMLGGGGQAANQAPNSNRNGANAGGRVALAEACDASFDSCDIAEPPRWGVWGGGIGSFGTVAGDASAHGTTYSLGGFSGGLDYRFTPNVLAGVTAGYSSATLYTQGMDGRGSSDTVQLGLYSELTSGPAYFDLLAGYARGDNRMWRPIVIPGLQPRTAQGQTHVDQFFGQVEGGWRFELGGTVDAFLTPFARLQGSTSTQAAFSETGADSLDLNVAAQTANSLRSVFGTQLGGDLDAGWRDRIHAVFRVGWSHEYADTSRPVTASFAGAPALSFTTQGAAAPRDGAIVGLAATTAVADATSLFLRYDGDLDGGNTAHTLSAGVRFIW